MKKGKSVVLKKSFLEARSRYLEKLRSFERNPSQRTLQDTAKTLTALKAQHDFIISEQRRLQRVIDKLKVAKKRVDPKLIKRLEKITKEDKENQQRFKLIKEYFEKTARGENNGN